MRKSCVRRSPRGLVSVIATVCGLGLTLSHSVVHAVVLYDHRDLVLTQACNELGSFSHIGGTSYWGSPVDGQWADDFTTLAPYRLTTVTVDMGHLPIQGSPDGGFLVEIFADVGGLPAEAPAFQAWNLSTYTAIGSFPPQPEANAAAFGNGLRTTYRLDLTSLNWTLPPGTWWISVVGIDESPFGSAYTLASKTSHNSPDPSQRGSAAALRNGGVDHSTFYLGQHGQNDWWRGSNNDFRELSLSIEGAYTTGNHFAAGGEAIVSDPTGNNNGVAEPGESLRLTLPVRNDSTVAATGITATLTSLTPTASIQTGNGTYSNLAGLASATNAAPFVILLSGSHPCGAPVNVRLNISSNNGSGTGQIDYTISTGTTGAVVVPWTGAVAIPDNTAGGANTTFVVSGSSGSISDLNFRFDGSVSDSVGNSSTVGLSHGKVGDLIVKLTSPQGTTVVLVNRPGDPSPTVVNNFYQLTLDDQADGESIQNISDATEQPVTGVFLPANVLSAFNGQNANGTWTLNVADMVADTNATRGMGGTIRGFTVTMTTLACQAAPAPTGACCTGSACTPGLTQAACTLGGGVFKGAGSTCTSSPCCPADFNGDNARDVADLFAYINAWLAKAPSADFNDSNNVDVADLFAYINAWLAGC